MKNKGRKHKAIYFPTKSNSGGLGGNCKGALTLLTRGINKMGRGVYGRGVSKKFIKRAWSKRVRGYFKSQTKDLME